MLALRRFLIAPRPTVFSVPSLTRSAKRIGAGRKLDRAKVEEFIQLDQHNILLNLRGVSYADTGGIEALLAIHADVNNIGGRVCFCDPNSEIEYLLSMTRLWNSKSVYSDEQEALASFG